MDRRTFLRGLGVAMALPMLDCMTFGGQVAARGASTAGGLPPRRLACVFFPNGVSLPEDPALQELNWFPTGSGRDYTMSKILSSLEPLRDQITILGGTEHINARGLHGHHAGDIWLTGANIRKAYNNSISIDQLIAGEIEDQTRFPHLVMSPEGGVGSPVTSQTLSFDGRGLPVPAANDPRRIFARMFGDNSADSIAAQRDDFGKQQSILDAVLDHAGDVKRKLGKADLARMDQYMDSVRDVEKRVAKAEQWLEKPKPQVDADAVRLELTLEEPAEFLRTYYDLMVLAFQTDSTRVATYQTCRERAGIADRLPIALGLPGWHRISHEAGKGEGWQNWAAIDTFSTEQFAYFLNRLKSVPEGGGTLLDSTMILYGCSSSRTHTALNFPTIVAGGSRCGLKHGQYLKLTQATPFSNVLYTLLDRMELPSRPTGFADSTGVIEPLVA